jgi:hypothetical protein
MPITFAPSYAGLAAGYAGSGLAPADVTLRGAQMLADKGADLMHMRFAADQRTANQTARAAEVNAGIAEHGAEFQARREDQGAQFSAEQQSLAARDQFHQQAQQQEMQSRFQLHVAMQQQDVSQAEKMQMQQLQQHKAWVNSEYTAGRITAQEAGDFMRSIDAGLQPLQHRAALTKVRQEQQEQQMVQHKNAQAESIRSMNEKFAAGQVDALPLITDPVTGVAHRMMRNHNGEWYDPFKGSRPEAGAAGSAKAEAQARQEYHKTYKEAQATVDRWRTERNNDEAKTPKYPELADTATYQQVIRQEMEARGVAPTMEAHVARRAGKQPAGGGDKPADTPPAAQPYSRQTPPEKLTPEQRNQVENFAAGLKALGGRPDAGEPPVRAAVESLNKVQDLTEQYGGNPAAMPPAVREEIRRRVAEIEKVQAAPPAPPKPPAPPTRFERGLADLAGSAY